MVMWWLLDMAWKSLGACASGARGRVAVERMGTRVGEEPPLHNYQGGVVKKTMPNI